jgi:hypothetical protein
MIKPSITLQELRRRIYRKAKAEKTWRFWGLYVHVCKLETLRFAMRQRGCRGFGWKRWSFLELPGPVLLSVVRESTPSAIGICCFKVKGSGKPDDRKGQVRFDAAGAGDGFTGVLVRHCQTKEAGTDRHSLRNTAPVLDPTLISFP